MITCEQYKRIKARAEEENAWLDTIRDKNGWASYKPEDKPVYIPTVSNDERSSLEVYEFCDNPPSNYFLYIGENPNGYTGTGSQHMATTWTGEYLGDVTFGKTFRSSFGDTRVSVTVRAINGRTYHGTYYKSAGSYARIKMYKG